MSVETHPFAHAYGGAGRVSDPRSAELRLLEHLAAADADGAAAMTEDRRIGDVDVVIDTPFGAFTGKAGARELAQGWHDRFAATRIDLSPVVQTRAGGRSVSEVLLHIAGDEPRDVPVTIVGDLHPGGTLDGARIYFFFRWAHGLRAYRAPIFVPTHAAPTSYALLTGAVRRYYELLHLPDDPAAAHAGIMALLAPGFRYGGYRPARIEPLSSDRSFIAEVYGHICSGIPSEQSIRFETLTDDGRTCCAEWTSVPTAAGEAAGVQSQGGFAAYERSPEGLLRAIRINDNLGPSEE